MNLSYLIFKIKIEWNEIKYFFGGIFEKTAK